ncbi:hypothetical protein Tco_0167494 [Tanacetum coccineum]
MKTEGSYYILHKQVFVDDAHYDMPLIYNVEGDVKFLSRVLPHKLGLKVTNLDLLGVIEDEELFGKLVDDDVVRVCLLLALEVIFMGKKLVDEVPDTLMRLVENLEDSTVNLDLTPTKSEHQSDWYKFFRDYYTAYVPRSAPTRYPDLFDDYLKKLSASRKRGNLETRDLPIIRRCNTTSVEEIRDRSFVANFFSNISSEYLDALNEEFHELYRTSFIDNRPAENGLDFDDDLVKDYLIQEEFRVKQEEEERCRLEELKMKEALFLSSLKEEVRITNGKRSQRSGAFSAYYWGDTFVNAEKDRPLNALNDQDMTQFLKDVTSWVEDLLCYNKAHDRVYLTDAFDFFLGRQGPLRVKFPWCKDVSVDRRFWETLVCLDPRKKGWIMDELWVNYMWHVRSQDADRAMVGGYFVQLLLQYTIPLWYVDGSRYKVAWSDVD